MSTRRFPCNTCNLSFEDSQAQRTHMRESWHVYNLKRRMTSLPPISADTYIEKVATSLVSSKQESSRATPYPTETRSMSGDEQTREGHQSGILIDEEARTNCCLWCTKQSNDPETNFEHMTLEHGLYLPDVERLSSLESIIGYLRTIVTEYNECLYCGITKPSTEGIRRHMLDRGHCMVNLDREPELLEFWDYSDSDRDNTEDDETPEPRARTTDTLASKDLSRGEYTLPSGKIIGSKGSAREANMLARRTVSAMQGTSSRASTKSRVENTNAVPVVDPNEIYPPSRGENQDRAVAKRDAAGLIGVSDQNMRSLFAVEKKMQRQQAMVRASAAWADELGGTHQKHYKVKMRLRDG